MLNRIRHSSAIDDQGPERVIPLSWQRNPPPLTLLGRAEIIAFQVAQALVPSWLRLRPDKQLPLKTPRETAYLDGLRGIVAILVFIRHFSLPWQLHLDYGYGDEGYNGFLRLPFLRLVFSGPLTPVFFIVSGYVLSAKSLKLSRRKAWEPLAIALAGSTFRRALRLFLAPVVSTLLVMVLAHFNCFSFPYSHMPGRQPVHPIALGSLWAQFLQWGGFVINELTNPWRWDIPKLQYGPHLWTIPVSFKGSLVVFIACLALVRTQGVTRLALLILGILSALLHSRWDMAPFLGGMLLCELDLRNAERLDHMKDLNQPAAPSRRILRRAFGLTCLIFGLYLGSFPRKNHSGNACVAGYQWFCVITHDYRYWHCIGAFFVMFAVSREEILQWPLKTALGQYLGKVSFSVYIIHEPFLHLFAFYTVPFFRRWTGESTELQSQAGFFMGMLFSGFWLLWLADLFKSYVEERCVTLAGWVESKLLS
ncbi:acyltransferase 3 [Diaporthe sp. PMI_573]|nr:acyltransferase 3 [Diaporthaceae sp. PMI_573]